MDGLSFSSPWHPQYLGKTGRKRQPICYSLNTFWGSLPLDIQTEQQKKQALHQTETLLIQRVCSGQFSVIYLSKLSRKILVSVGCSYTLVLSSAVCRLVQYCLRKEWHVYCGVLQNWAYSLVLLVCFQWWLRSGFISTISLLPTWPLVRA